jgi:hypothetical protein
VVGVLRLGLGLRKPLGGCEGVVREEVTSGKWKVEYIPYIAAVSFRCASFAGPWGWGV